VVLNSGSGLAYDPSSDVVYMVDGFSHPSGALYTLDQSTGAATLVGPFNIGLGPYSDLRGTALDTRNGVLYAAAGVGGADLYWIDVTNGSAHHIAAISGYPPSGAEFGGLAYDSKRDQLVWLIPTGDLAVIDRSTGVATLLYDLPETVPSTEGLTYDPEKDLLWASDNGGSVFSYDPSNGYTRTYFSQACCAGIQGLAYRTPAPIDTPALSAPARVLLVGLLMISSAVWIALRPSRTRAAR
jgi:hypothetical protein